MDVMGGYVRNRDPATTLARGLSDISHQEYAPRRYR
jgi:hypothetical protein